MLIQYGWRGNCIPCLEEMIELADLGNQSTTQFGFLHILTILNLSPTHAMFEITFVIKLLSCFPEVQLSWASYAVFGGLGINDTVMSSFVLTSVP